MVGRLLEVGAEVWIPVFDSKELIAFPFRDHSSVHTVEGVDLTAPAAVETSSGPSQTWQPLFTLPEALPLPPGGADPGGA